MVGNAPHMISQMITIGDLCIEDGLVLVVIKSNSKDRMLPQRIRTEIKFQIRKHTAT